MQSIILGIREPIIWSRTVPSQFIFPNRLLLLRLGFLPRQRVLVLGRAIHLVERRPPVRSLQLPMQSQILIVPIDLSPICLPMSLRVPFCGPNAGPRVDEQETRHGEGCKRSHNRLLLG
jgi:hypothetical protein